MGTKKAPFQITPEMIEAGQKVMGEWYQSDNGTKVLLTRAYRAMRVLEPDSGKSDLDAQLDEALDAK